MYYRVSMTAIDDITPNLPRCEELEVRLADSVLWLQLNRPQALNALTPALVEAMGQAIAAAGADPKVRVVVLSGAGRAFCAGADLKESEKRSKLARGNVAFIRALGELATAIESCSRPVIAAVNGIALAGGLELMLACDMVLAAESARLGDAHSNYAMFPGAGATVRLPRRIGLVRAKQLMLTGDFLSAEDALAIGLVDRVVPDAALEGEVLALAAKLAVKSPLVLARMKEALNDAIHQPAETALRRERDLNELHALSFDRAEGLAAFREKRPPQFQGR